MFKFAEHSEHLCSCFSKISSFCRSVKYFRLGFRRWSKALKLAAGKASPHHGNPRFFSHSRISSPYLGSRFKVSFPTVSDFKQWGSLTVILGQMPRIIKSSRSKSKLSVQYVPSSSPCQGLYSTSESLESFLSFFLQAHETSCTSDV